MNIGPDVQRHDSVAYVERLERQNKLLREQLEDALLTLAAFPTGGDARAAESRGTHRDRDYRGDAAAGAGASGVVVTPDDVIVSRHYLRRTARAMERTNPTVFRVKRARRGPHRYYVVRRP